MRLHPTDEAKHQRPYLVSPEVPPERAIVSAAAAPRTMCPKTAPTASTAAKVWTNVGDRTRSSVGTGDDGVVVVPVSSDSSAPPLDEVEGIASPPWTSANVGLAPGGEQVLLQGWRMHQTVVHIHERAPAKRARRPGDPTMDRCQGRPGPPGRNRARCRAAGAEGPEVPTDVPAVTGVLVASPGKSRPTVRA